MDRDDAEAICAAQPGAWADSPWEPGEIVYKVGPAERGKIFCFLGTGATPNGAISIKVDPELVSLLHDRYEAVSPPPYLSKRHWIAVALNGDMPDDELAELIEDSYSLVVQTLPKRLRPTL